jgi:hypothetical protein
VLDSLEGAATATSERFHVTTRQQSFHSILGLMTLFELSV